VDADALIQAGLAHHEAGRLDEAEAIYRAVLGGAPDNVDGLHLLGLVHLARGDATGAVDLISRAAAAAPTLAPLQASLGDALLAAGRDDDAAQAFERALAALPDNVGAAINLASLRLKARRFDEAIALAHRAAALAPDHAPAQASLGAALAAAGREGEALVSLDAALALDPAYDAARSARAQVLGALGRDEEAEAEHRRLVAADPKAPDRLANFGIALMARQRNAEAEELFRRALFRDPDFPEALNALGLIRKAARANDEATALFRRALAARPGYADALNNLGHLLVEQNRLEEGTRLLEQAVERAPNNMTAWGNFIQALDTAESLDDRRHLAARRALDKQLLARAPLRKAWTVTPDPERRLRIGYVSTDFHSNSAGLLVLPIVTNHAKDKVEVYCYSDSRLDDPITARFRGAADVWREIAGMSDRAVDELIVEDRIDVLVDLSGYTTARFAALARKPAPVLLSGWGFGHGMGLSAYDGLLLDPVVAPPEIAGDFPDPIVHLPIWLCYVPPVYAPDQGVPPMRRRGYPTFGCFNRVAKIQQASYDCFAGILRAEPRARLLFKDGTAGDPAVQAEVRAKIGRSGGDGERVDFLGATPHREHLAAIADVDVMLNPFPYGGGMSAVECLWMGVPIVALLGRRQQERGTPSFLTFLGLEDFVASTVEDYVAIATRAARDPTRLETLRSSIRDRMRASVLCDPARYVRAVEDAYRALWRRWCKTGSAR
jgi:predicted O-linked N-acetylglucosamine transferase (SPINDLY family)